MIRHPPRPPLFPYTTLFRSRTDRRRRRQESRESRASRSFAPWAGHVDRKSTRLNSSHVEISYAVFCLKKKKNRELLNFSFIHFCELFLIHVAGNVCFFSTSN